MESVLYTQRVEVIESYQERRDCADQRIPEFIWKCGFFPVAVPNLLHIAAEMIERYKICGIILTGGNSLVKYGGNAPERDEIDKILIQKALDKRIPLYGFCRGMQSILDYFGSELINIENHVAIKHIVKGERGSFYVNSYHNQGCVNLAGNTLKAVMRSEDDIIEMVRHDSMPIVGTMWHPEREHPFTQKSIDLVRSLFGGE